ncbi:hypothetical protein AHMF7616_05174 [Adhaeribacter pallidiroseus]|uniref:Uncharacterized protein n=2 Tax=Adhaeribacter pallidiroseus TaxID=2072847 RepID=A0A369QNT8_9BACT|nr:hypothetical protein AHMF7616_05174 [Adhaeribacter pallidiroseus]
MKFMVSLIAGYIYFSVALADSFKNFSYPEPLVPQTMIVEPAVPEKPIVAKAAMTKIASFVEKSGYPL